MDIGFSGNHNKRLYKCVDFVQWFKKDQKVVMQTNRNIYERNPLLVLFTLTSIKPYYSLVSSTPIRLVVDIVVISINVQRYSQVFLIMNIHFRYDSLPEYQSLYTRNLLYVLTDSHFPVFVLSSFYDGWILFCFGYIIQWFRREFDFYINVKELKKIFSYSLLHPRKFYSTFNCLCPVIVW